jgi:hypothetical protein
LSISSAVGSSFAFKSGLHDLISIKVLKMITLGAVRTFLLIAMSFLVFQIVHRALAQMKSVTLRLASRHLPFCFRHGCYCYTTGGEPERGAEAQGQ